MVAGRIFAVAVALSSAAVFPAAPAFAQTSRAEQSMMDTLCAHFKRRGIDATEDCAAFNTAGTPAAKTRSKFNAALNEWARTGCAVSQGLTQSFWSMVRCHMADLGLAFPLKMGEPGFDGQGGSFGGGGATGEWKFDCGTLTYQYDASFNLIIPSMPLKSGGPLTFNGPMFHTGSRPGGFHQSHGDTLQAATKRGLHLTNMQRAKADWYGVIGFSGSALLLATVAYRNSAGTIVTRVTATEGATQTTVGPPGEHNGITHKECPEAEGGAGFDFYGYNAGTDWPSGWIGPHMHSCIWFAPDASLSSSGYAINDFTTIPNSSVWPGDYPAHLKGCPINRELLRAMTDKIWKKANDTPGYDGAPYQPILPTDLRPGDTTVGDLTEVADPIPATADPNAPPPVPADPPSPTSPGVDLGPNPNVGAPTLEAVPTGIMDPIFNWLPDLPSITLDVGSATCPTWAVDLSAFGGSGWSFTLESQCPLMEDNRAAIGALMVVLFGLGAAFIILRA